MVRIVGINVVKCVSEGQTKYTEYCMKYRGMIVFQILHFEATVVYYVNHPLWLPQNRKTNIRIQIQLIVQGHKSQTRTKMKNPSLSNQNTPGMSNKTCRSINERFPLRPYCISQSRIWILKLPGLTSTLTTSPLWNKKPDILSIIDWRLNRCNPNVAIVWSAYT